jgi:hypothetical protein
VLFGHDHHDGWRTMRGRRPCGTHSIKGHSEPLLSGSFHGRASGTGAAVCASQNGNWWNGHSARSPRTVRPSASYGRWDSSPRPSASKCWT